VLLDMSAKYNGEESSTSWMDFSSFILGSEGNTFGTDLETMCVAPDGMTEVASTDYLGHYHLPTGTADAGDAGSCPHLTHLV
jgi:hypothetical protein